MRPPSHSKSLALVYLARGADGDHLVRFKSFLQSYTKFSAGAEHSLFIIYKGFVNEGQRRTARELFSIYDHRPIFTSDTAFDIGAYTDSLEDIPHDRICFLNTNSEILCDGWLGKLSANLDQPRVGVVSATASFESLTLLDPRFPRFPNVHIRSNAFMMERATAIKVLTAFHIRDKKDAFFAESGPRGMTRRIFEMGLNALVVGRNGRGYPPAAWPMSDTFRLGTQRNLLVHDNVTRAYVDMPFSEKRSISKLTWGEYLNWDKVLALPVE
ncbi:hypothetical protein QA633_31470 [Bradyrhizobium barranii]|uniref:hypothetical protein n=1 Tax=Bradyrhizobium barranii TaxID=2992140 RepID=UPI0024AFAF9C|nr:hypothetical protein [Bradyrhizobium barranii]WFT92831.1 hypothetical protein QA633_31470 [Bradyrhizobium barranii]